jgi:hypothetical protein
MDPDKRGHSGAYAPNLVESRVSEVGLPLYGVLEYSSLHVTDSSAIHSLLVYCWQS